VPVPRWPVADAEARPGGARGAARRSTCGLSRRWCRACCRSSRAGVSPHGPGGGARSELPLEAHDNLVVELVLVRDRNRHAPAKRRTYPSVVDLTDQVDRTEPDTADAAGASRRPIPDARNLRSVRRRQVHERRLEKQLEPVPDPYGQLDRRFPLATLADPSRTRRSPPAPARGTDCGSPADRTARRPAPRSD